MCRQPVTLYPATSHGEGTNLGIAKSSHDADECTTLARYHTAWWTQVFCRQIWKPWHERIAIAGYRREMAPRPD